MAGHNKWSQIKHKKAKEDAKKGKAFTVLTKEITVAAKDGGGDPVTNARLRFLLEKARHINMPSDNVKRAIQRGTGELPGAAYESYQYEGYGPHGVAVIVETLSDNKNRTVADIRHAFSRGGGNVAESGAVNWMFDRLGILSGPLGNQTEDSLWTALLEADIVDLNVDNNQYRISCHPRSIDQVKKIVNTMGLKLEHAEIEWIAKTPITLSEEQANTVIDFLNTLEEMDDVQQVYVNLE